MERTIIWRTHWPVSARLRRRELAPLSGSAERPLRPAAPTPSALRNSAAGPLLTPWLPALTLLVVFAATLAAAPLLWEAALGPGAVPVQSAAAAAALGQSTGHAVRLTAEVDNSRRVRFPQRGGAVYYAPVKNGDGLLVRTSDPDQLRARPAVIVGRVQRLDSLEGGERLWSQLRDDRGAPVPPDAPVLVDRNLLGDALTAGGALLVAWAAALSGLWLFHRRQAPGAEQDMHPPVLAAPNAWRPARRLARRRSLRRLHSA